MSDAPIHTARLTPPFITSASRISSPSDMSIWQAGQAGIRPAGCGGAGTGGGGTAPHRGRDQGVEQSARPVHQPRPRAGRSDGGSANRRCLICGTFAMPIGEVNGPVRPSAARPPPGCRALGAVRTSYEVDEPSANAAQSRIGHHEGEPSLVGLSAAGRPGSHHASPAAPRSAACSTLTPAPASAHPVRRCRTGPAQGPLEDGTFTGRRRAAGQLRHAGIRPGSCPRAPAAGRSPRERAATRPGAGRRQSMSSGS